MSIGSGQDECAQRTAAIRQRYRQFVLERIGRRHRSPVLIVIGALLLFSVVLIPSALVLIYKGIRGRIPNQAALDAELAFIDRAEAVMAFPIMINTMLRKTGDVAAPGVFVLPGPDVPDSLSWISKVILSIEEPPSDVPEEDRLFLSTLLDDEQYTPGRRRRLPASITEGRPVYVVDLAVHPWYLLDKHVHEEMPMVPCLAEPGDAGLVRAVPYWCAFDVQPPAHADRTPGSSVEDRPFEPLWRPMRMSCRCGASKRGTSPPRCRRSVRGRWSSRLAAPARRGRAAPGSCGDGAAGGPFRRSCATSQRRPVAT